MLRYRIENEMDQDDSLPFECKLSEFMVFPTLPFD